MSGAKARAKDKRERERERESNRTVMMRAKAMEADGQQVQLLNSQFCTSTIENSAFIGERLANCSTPGCVCVCV